MARIAIRAIFWSLKLHVRSKVCIAPIHMRSKVCKFALHMEGSNADFAPHMEGSHANFALHMERRHSFRDQIISKTASFANFQWEIFKTTRQYLRSLYDLYDHF